MQRLLAGRTTFIIAHRLSTIARADIIVVLHRGRIVEVGNHESLLRHRGAYASMLDRQKQDSERKSAPRREAVRARGSHADAE